MEVGNLVFFPQILIELSLLHGEEDASAKRLAQLAKRFRGSDPIHGNVAWLGLINSRISSHLLNTSSARGVLPEAVCGVMSQTFAEQRPEMSLDVQTGQNPTCWINHSLNAVFQSVRRGAGGGEEQGTYHSVASTQRCSVD